MKISFATTCMGRAHHLKQTLPANLAHNVDWTHPNAVEFVVLDYSSPDDLGEWLLSDPAIAPYLEAGIVRYARHEGEQFFRHSHAKNMAHRLASGDFVCNLDADNFTGPRFADHLRGIFTKKPHSFVSANFFDGSLNQPPYIGCMGRVAMKREDFFKIGGYNEDRKFEGWSGEDFDMFVRACKHLISPHFISDRKYLECVTHSNEERVANTAHAGQERQIDLIKMLDGGPFLKKASYFFRKSVAAPRKANAGHGIGEGAVRVVSKLSL